MRHRSKNLNKDSPGRGVLARTGNPVTSQVWRPLFFFFSWWDLLVWRWEDDKINNPFTISAYHRLGSTYS